MIPYTKHKFDPWFNSKFATDEGKNALARLRRNTPATRRYIINSYVNTDGNFIW